MSMIGDAGPAQLGHRIAQLREQARMKQAELARKTPWSQTVLSRIESGERVVEDDELENILRAIGTQEALDLAITWRRTWKHLPRPALDHADQDLLWRAEQMTATLKELVDSDDISKPFERRLDEYVMEIHRLAKRLMRREHQIAFIGPIGIGKSTAICRATGLETTGSNGRREPVLETGAGRITLCDVHLRVGPGYGIIVEPLPEDQIRQEVADFADQLIRAAQKSPASDESDETVQAVPSELERVIRNMAGLTPNRKKGPDGKRVVIDPAAALVARVPARRELVVEILTLMDLQRRDRRDAWFDPATAADALEWLRRTFAEINNGRHPEFSLPARIELVVEKLIKIGDLSIGLVDTRGLDEITVRADLEAHLADPHTVSILCSAFNDAPSQSVRQLLKRAREIGNPQIETNCSVLVLPRPNEAIAMKDESGLGVEDAADGYELKSEQVTNALTPYALPIRFFNALEDDRQRLLDHMDDRVTHTRGVFGEELEVVLSGADKLLANLEHEQVQEIQREVGRIVAAWVGEHSSPPSVSEHVHDTLLEVIAQIHPATVHASVRREGDWESLRYSHQLGHGARRLAVAWLRTSVEGFTDLCHTLTARHPEASELLSQGDRLIVQFYEELLRKMRLAGIELYRQQLQGDTEMWLACEAEWGRGTGYRERVRRHTSQWFATQPRIDLEAEVWTVLRREWEGLLGRLGSIFDTE